MTRNGKIARQPWSIRELLNRRLRDGEPGKSLVEWLNSLPKVQEVLDEEFGRRPINEQNLSEWKQGGYEDWLRHQETRAWVQELANQSEELEEETGDFSVADLLSVPLAVALGHCLHNAATKAPEDPKQAQILLLIARELTLLRRTDHSGQRLRLERERREEEQNTKRQAEIEMHWSKMGAVRARVDFYAKTHEGQYAEKKRQGPLSAEEEAYYQKVFADIAEWRREFNTPSDGYFPWKSNQAESNPIKVNQAT
jgi:hypothetical protein